MAEEGKPASVKVTETVPEASPEEAPLTRKRTRDDFENEEESDTKPEDRKIAPIKRRKDIIEEKKVDTPEKVSESVATDSVSEVDAEKEEKEENKKEEDTTAKETTTTEKEDDSIPQETITQTKDEEKLTAADDLKTESSKDDEKKEGEKPESSKFVFGSTTPFGANAFSLLNKNKNVFESKETSKSPTASTPSVFGSNSKFGNAFQSAITKKSIFDKTPEEQEKEKEEVEKSRETTPAISGNLYKQVELEKKDIKSGEEDEEHIFTCRAKLYALDLTNVKEGWRERGIGNVHVNKAKEAGKSARIIMRSIGLLKVILNTPLVEGLEVVKGMPSSLASEKFIRITIVENNKPVQYALKTGNPETTTNLYESIVDLIPKSA